MPFFFVLSAVVALTALLLPSIYTLVAWLRVRQV